MNGQGFYSSLESDLKLKSMAPALHIKTSWLVLSRLMIILSTDNSVRAWPSANWMVFDFMTLLKTKHLKFDLVCLKNWHNLKKAEADKRHWGSTKVTGGRNLCPCHPASEGLTVCKFSFHNSLWLCSVLACLKQTNKALFLVIVNHQLAAAFRRRDTSALQSCLGLTEVVPYQ